MKIKRLTEKKMNGRYDLTEIAKEDLQKCLFTQVEQKLGQLEDVEDELGIDLVTLFKALKNGIYVKTKNGISHIYNVKISKWQQAEICLFYRPYSHIRLKDFGKTWALTREELE